MIIASVHKFPHLGLTLSEKHMALGIGIDIGGTEMMVAAVGSEFGRGS